MSKTTVDSVETWDLSEFIAMLCEVARDAGAEEGRVSGAESEGQALATPVRPVGER